MQEITLLSDERAARYRSLREISGREDGAGLVLVEGPDALALLFRSPLEIESIFLDRQYLSYFTSTFEKRPDLFERCLVADKSLMSEFVGYRLHRGAMALVKRPPACGLTELSFPIVALNGLVDSENIGSIIRSAQAFGISSFLVDASTADPLLRRSIRVSMGSALLSKICYVDRLENALRQLQTKGRIIVCEQSPRARKLWDCRFDNESIFVFGKEKGGISPEILSFAHEQVIIPMETEVVDSLNVACAAAILFAYFRRS